MKKWLLTLALVLAVCFGVQEAEAAVVVEGQCGPDAYWALEEDGTLTISGTGPMYDYVGKEQGFDDYLEGAAPWAGTPWVDEEYWDSGSDEWKNALRVNHVVIEEGITHVGDFAFQSCTYLYSAVLPESLLTIGDKAFQSCARMTSINFPGSLQSIGDYAFHWCNGIESFEAPETLTHIGKGAFAYCAYIESITLPSTLTRIEDEAFMRNENLNNITIPGSVTYIGDNAFFGCFDLDWVLLPDSLKTLGDQAFGWCYDLVSVDLPEGLETIGDGAFWLCKGLRTVNLPQSLNSIGSRVFEFCWSLESLDLPAGITEIPDRMATQCWNLESLSAQGSITRIGEYALSQCTSLVELVIPASVKAIGNYAFDQCTGLTGVAFLGSAPEMADSIFLETEGVEVLYPRQNYTWTPKVRKDYGGSLTWTPYGEARPSEGYSDVDQSAWYVPAVDYVLDAGLMNGLPGEVFKPGGTMSRAMMAQVLYNCSGEGYVGTPSFADVKDGDWYADAVAWAEEAGVMSGFEDGTFRPNQAVTRQQLAVMFYNYAAFLGRDVSAQGDLTQFSDWQSTGSWALKAMHWAVGEGILNGVSGGRLNPAGTATRAQAAQMFTRFFGEAAG